jgi:hypothetical protein
MWFNSANGLTVFTSSLCICKLSVVAEAFRSTQATDSCVYAELTVHGALCAACLTTDLDMLLAGATVKVRVKRV